MNKTVVDFETFCRRVVASGDVPSIKELLLLCHVVKLHGGKGTLTPAARQMFIVGGVNLIHRLGRTLPEALAMICSASEPELRVLNTVRSIDRQLAWVINHVTDLGVKGVHVDPAALKEAPGDSRPLTQSPWSQQPDWLRLRRPSEVPAPILN